MKIFKEKTKKEDIIEDIQRLSDIVAMSESKGGKRIVASLKKDSVSVLSELRQKYQTVSHAELISLVAKFSERVSVLNMFSQAKKNKVSAEEELAFIVEEEKQL